MRGGSASRRDVDQGRPAAGQRPWHFLYFWPEPHQQGSLRPIRAPGRREAGLRLAGRHRRRPLPLDSSRAGGHRVARRGRPATDRARRAAGRPRPAAARRAPRSTPLVAAAAPRRAPRRAAGRRRGPAAPAARLCSSGDSPGGGVAGDGDPEDRRRDLVADQVAQLLVELERLAPELVERVLLGVAAQADARAACRRARSGARPTASRSSAAGRAARRAPSRSRRPPAVLGRRARASTSSQEVLERSASRPPISQSSSSVVPSPSRPIALSAAASASMSQSSGVSPDR